MFYKININSSINKKRVISISTHFVRRLIIINITPTWEECNIWEGGQGNGGGNLGLWWI